MVVETTKTLKQHRKYVHKMHKNGQINLNDT